MNPWEATTPAAKLCRAADKSGVTPRYGLKDAEWLLDNGIKPKDVTPAIVNEAERLDRAWFNHLIRKAEFAGFQVYTSSIRQTNNRPKKEEKPKREPKPPKEPKPEVVKDTSGSRVNSVSSMINQAMSSTKPQTIEQIAKKSGAEYSRVKGHMKWLKARNLAKEVSEGKWVSTIEIVDPTKPKTPDKPKPKAKPTLCKGTVLGYCPFAVARWAGQEGYKYGELVMAVIGLADILDFETVDLKPHWAAGRIGDDEYGEPAELTLTEIAEFEGELE